MHAEMIVSFQITAFTTMKTKIHLLNMATSSLLWWLLKIVRGIACRSVALVWKKQCSLCGPGGATAQEVLHRHFAGYPAVREQRLKSTYGFRVTAHALV
jgi:hypothetical protein